MKNIFTGSQCLLCLNSGHSFILTILLVFIGLALSNHLLSQKVTFKDNDDNVLMEVSDEGRSGSILLLPDISPLNIKDKLYNIGGNIYWSGLKLGSESEAAGWRLSDPELTLLDNSYNVGLGTSTPLGKLHIRQESTQFAFRVDDKKSDLSPFIIDHEGNVGIGIGVPSQKLEIAGKLKLGDDTATESAGVIRFNTGTSEFEGFNGTSWLSFGGGGKWLSNGRKIYYDLNYVGIGIDDPGFPLEVTRTNTSDDNTPIASFQSEGFNSSGSIRVKGSNSSYWDFGITQNPDDAFAINYNGDISATTDLFRLTPGGFLGLGTTEPSAKLHVIGDARIEDTGSPIIEFYNGSTYVGYSGVIGSDMYFSNFQSGNLYFRTHDATYMTIDGIGNVGMGTFTPISKLHVEGNTENEVALMVNNVDATGLQQIQFGTNPATDAGMELYNGSTTGTLPGKYRFYNNRPSGHFEWLTGGQVKMVFTADDRLGIGDVSPSAKAHIAQINDEDAFRVDDTADDPTPFIVKGDGAVGIGILNPTAKTHIAQYASDADAFRVDDEASDTSPFIIDDEGMVGVGTPSPTENLHVNGRIRVGDSSDPEVEVGSIRYNSSKNDFEGYIGNWVSLTNPNQISGLETVIDIDGNVYGIATIGSQTWMRENLRTSKFNDGTTIDELLLHSDWISAIFPAWCWYANNQKYDKDYGKLYNEYTVNPALNGNKNVCPTGWHIPSLTEWETLENNLGGDLGAGRAMKEADTQRWQAPNIADNGSGFTGLPGGYRSSITSFSSLGFQGIWWSSTPVDSDYINVMSTYNDSAESILGGRWRYNGYSIRCIKD